MAADWCILGVKMSQTEQNEQSIEDILANIRSAIKQTPPSKTPTKPSTTTNYELVELTEVIGDDGKIVSLKNDEKITLLQENQLYKKTISDSVKSESKFSSATQENEDLINPSDYAFDNNIELDKFARSKLEKRVQEWLDLNLPTLAREILEKQISDLLNKIRS